MDRIDRGHWQARVIDAVVLALASAAAWWVWLGWDDTYYTDPATGDSAGPYRTWQVVACVLTLLVVVVVGYRQLHPAVVGVVVTIAFTGAYASSALPDDESGLAGLGVAMVFVGMVITSTVTGALAHVVRGSRGTSRGGR